MRLSPFIQNSEKNLSAAHPPWAAERAALRAATAHKRSSKVKVMPRYHPKDDTQW
jgi:hypothetical protein